jgi:diguanylate cyclase (GGDEF)-like protein/PAS domain S-box-containing protein
VGNDVQAITGSYSWGLVILSVALAVLASYAALDLAGRVTSSQGRVRRVWLGSGAVAMGLGIWSMHFVGMLAFSMPTPVYYHVPTVAASLVAAILASAVALYVVSRSIMGILQVLAGSLAMGAGIAAMHYIGMAAMRCAAVVTYNTGIVLLSIGIAVAISFVALQLAFRARSEDSPTLHKLLSAIAMGLAIPLLHYSGMWAASFYPSRTAPNLHLAVGTSMIATLVISCGSIAVLAAAVAVSFFDRYFSLQRVNLSALRQSELYFHTMAEAVPEIIWTANPNGDNDFFNQKCFDYTGLTHEQMRGSGWTRLIHPDDVDNCFAEWQNALKIGEPYEVEYRLRGKDGNYRWFLGRANPIRDAEGKIFKWFGTCTDIENQKHNQQILEEQILERTTQLAEANTRLQEEMLEKDFARSELDLQNENTMTELQERSDRATMLAKMGELLQSCISRDEVLAAALGYAPKIFAALPGAIALMNGDRSLAEVIGSWSDCQLSTREFEPIECWALRTGHPHLVVAGDTTACCSHAAKVKQTYLCIPILAQGETLGVVHFQSTEKTPGIDPTEISFKTTFAGQVGLSIANIRLREALRTQSVRDGLTGLFNRRHLDEILEREFRRAGRGGLSLGVLMLDLDHFKSFNDTYGHDAGDAVLRETAAFLLENVRAEDFVCRYGGEEFVVILPTADANGACTRAERLRSKMRESNIMYQGRSLGLITFSIGVAAFPEHGMSPREVMAAADAALYEAKRSGRDKVVIATVKGTAEGTAETVPASPGSAAGGGQ